MNRADYADAQSTVLAIGHRLLDTPLEDLIAALDNGEHRGVFTDKLEEEDVGRKVVRELSVALQPVREIARRDLGPSRTERVRR
jgi:hypothetical protein